MSAEPIRDPVPPLDDLSQGLVGSLGSDDARMGSGVPEGQRADELTFIQLTGITRTVAPQAAEEAAENEEEAPPSTLLEDLDPAKPLSFYEKGVVDVDHTLRPAAVAPREDEVLAAPEPEIEEAPEPAANTSADAFQDLLAVLQRPPAETEAPEEMSASEETPSEEPALPPLEPRSWLDTPVEPEPPAVAATIADARDTSALIEQDWPEFAAEPAPPAPQHTPISEIAPPEPAPTLGAPAPPVIEVAAPPRPSPPAPVNALAEAERLLQALERPGPAVEIAAVHAATIPAPKSIPIPEPAVQEPLPSPLASPAFPEYQAETPYASGRGSALLEEDQHEEDATDGYALPNTSSGRRRSKNRVGRQRRRVVRMLVSAASVVVLAIAAYWLYHLIVRPSIATSEDVYREATGLLARGQFLEAGQAFATFAERSPDDPRAGAALFSGAIALQQGLPPNADAARRVNERSAALLESFISRNPADMKKTRAICLLGVVYTRLENYDRVIELLRTASPQVSDPLAAIPALRTLARAYAKRGDLEAAESTYLQAAVFARNYTADVDYFELGEMYRIHALSAASREERVKHQRKAIEYLTLAMRVPESSPRERDGIQKTITWLNAELGPLPELEAAPGAATATDSAAAVATQPAPTSTEAAAWQPDVDAETNFIENAAPKPLEDDLSASAPDATQPAPSEATP